MCVCVSYRFLIEEGGPKRHAHLQRCLPSSREQSHKGVDGEGEGEGEVIRVVVVVGLGGEAEEEEEEEGGEEGGGCREGGQVGGGEGGWEGNGSRRSGNRVEHSNNRATMENLETQN